MHQAALDSQQHPTSPINRSKPIPPSSMQRAPSVLSDLTNQGIPTKSPNDPRWRRIPRQNIGTDIVMEKCMGQKRSANFEVDHSVLPGKKKKKVVSHNDKENIEILAETGFQPCQKQ